MVTMVKYRDNKRLGVPVFDKQGHLVDYLEKPENPPNEYAIPGLYFFDSNVFSCFKGQDRIVPSARGEYEINAPFLWLIKHGFNVGVIEYKGKWLDPGKFDDWLESNRYLLKNKLDEKMETKVGSDSEILGRASIGKRCKIRNSVIKGPVSIGNDVVIEDSQIGPHTSIYDGSTIISSKVEDTILMGGVKIFNVKFLIKGSLIGTGSEVSENGEDRETFELFVGEKSQVKI